MVGELAVDSRVYAGNGGLWAGDNDGEQHDWLDDTFPDLDIDIEMSCKVDSYFHFPNRYLRKKWEAQGTVRYDIADRTIHLDFLVRTGKTLRENIEVTWKVDEDKPIKEEISKSRLTKSDIEWENDHSMWDMWDNNPYL